MQQRSYYFNPFDNTVTPAYHFELETTVSEKPALKPGRRSFILGKIETRLEEKAAERELKARYQNEWFS